MATEHAVVLDGKRHAVDGEDCSVCWNDYPVPCECGGMIHAAFGDENFDGDYWLYEACSRCGSDYSARKGKPG